VLLPQHEYRSCEKIDVLGEVNMNYIVVGTNSPDSRSAQVAKVVQQLYRNLGETIEILDLNKLDLSTLDGQQYWQDQPAPVKAWVDLISQSRSLVMIVPEYNGSFPGILKYFIDHWKFPDSFECRPVSFIGLGGRFGGLRAVEHLQQVFAYRNAYLFPERVFFMNCSKTIVDGQINDPIAMDLLQLQVKNFSRFVTALESAGLDALSVAKTRVKGK
jgi:NAD(P)H-dependent FMN reductase